MYKCLCYYVTREDWDRTFVSLGSQNNIRPYTRRALQMCLLWCWLKKPVAFCYMEMLGRSRVSPSLDSSSSSVLVFLKRKNSNGVQLQAKKAELNFNKQRSKNIFFGVWVSWIKQQLPDPDRHRAYIPQLPVITSLVTSSTSTMDTGRKGRVLLRSPFYPGFNLF